MDSETFQRMNFEKCCESMRITKSVTDPEEIEIVKYKNLWINNFQPLLKFVIDKNSDKKIDSKDLGELWLFYVDGLHIRNLFSKLSQKQVQELLHYPNSLENIIYDKCEEVTKCGVFLYQAAYYFTMSKLKLEESIIRYQNIYIGDDPIIWLKNNNDTWKLRIHNKHLEEKNKELCELWRRVYKVSNLSLDPAFQS